MLEKLGFQQLVEETLTVKRVTRAMPMYQFVLAMVLAVYVGFSRLHHLRFLEREPMLTGILKVLRLPSRGSDLPQPMGSLEFLRVHRTCGSGPVETGGPRRTHALTGSMVPKPLLLS